MTTPNPLPEGALERHARDLELARKALSGDPPALRCFWERMQCVPRILSVANSRMGGPLSQHDLADLSQDTLIVIWKKLETFAGRATLETWVHRFCYLELMNRVRGKKRLSRQSAGSFEVATETVAAKREASPLEYEHLELSLQELGPPEADILRLKHYEELTFAEIGALLGMSPSTAKTQYYRGIAWLRRHLAEHSIEGQL